MQNVDEKLKNIYPETEKVALQQTLYIYFLIEKQTLQNTFTHLLLTKNKTF